VHLEALASTRLRPRTLTRQASQYRTGEPQPPAAGDTARQSGTQRQLRNATRRESASAE